MPAQLFKDISKTTNNILNDDYDFNRKLKIKTKTSNGIVFTTEGTMAGNNAILAKMSAAYSHPSGLNINKLQVSTHGRLTGEFDLNNAFFDGLKLSFKMEDGSQKNAAGIKYRPAAAVGAEYRTDKFSTNAEADFANNLFSGSGAFHLKSFVLGGQLAYSVEKSALIDQNAGLSFTGKDFHASLVSKKKFNVISASMDHLQSPNLAYAVLLDYDLKSKVNTLTVGSRYALDELTTLCGKMDSDGLMSLALVQKLRPQVALTTTAHIDVKNIEGESHKFGIGITLG